MYFVELIFAMWASYGKNVEAFLDHIKMVISQNDKYSMVLGPASLYLLSVQSYKE